jgi:hypothetical protein
MSLRLLEKDGLRFNQFVFTNATPHYMRIFIQTGAETICVHHVWISLVAFARYATLDLASVVGWAILIRDRFRQLLMIARSTGAVWDTITNVSPASSFGLIALSAARWWSLGKITTKGSFTRRRNARSGSARSLRRKAASIFPFERPSASNGGILTRYHHVNVRQLVAQDPQGFRHPGQFVSSQKAHREARLGGMNSSPRSFGSRINLQENSARVIKKDSTRRCQL